MSAEPGFDDRAIAYLLEVVDLARLGETARLEEQLAAGISVNLTNEVGDTLLMLASYHGRADTVEMLLLRGADHDRLNGRGQTALGSAVFRQDAAIVRRLLAAGADPDRGAPSASTVASVFGLSSMTDILRGASTQ